MGVSTGNMLNIIIQILFVGFSFVFAYFQVPIIKAMRDYVPLNNPYNKTFHNRGWLVVVFVGMLTTSLYCASLLSNCSTEAIIGNALVFLPLLGLIHWIVFDLTIGHYVYRDKWYIGKTAKIDRFLIRVIGEDFAGVIKALVVAVIILCINFYL